MGYTISVSFIEFLRKFCAYVRKFCAYDEILSTIAMLGKILNLKDKLGQILCADKTGFRRLSHIYGYVLIYVATTYVYTYV